MKTTSSSKKERGKIAPTTLQEQIARRAHELWEKEGRPKGRDCEHWIAAEEQMLGLANPGVESAVPWDEPGSDRMR